MKRLVGEVSYHNQSPDGVVEEDGGGYNEHACAYEGTELEMN